MLKNIPAMSILLMILFFFTTVSDLSAQVKQDDPKTYAIYDEAGKAVSFHKMIQKLARYDVILFGEFHDHPVVHWLQLQTTAKLHQTQPHLNLGAEMFEADNQVILNEYLQGKIEQNRFEEEMRLWDNYETDYKPLVEFAKLHQLAFIATNTPRRYASTVSKKGIDSLQTFNEEAKRYFAKLPISVDTITPGYSEMFKMMGPHATKIKAMHFVEAQALKDATMAQRIAENVPENGIFLHFNGDYHSRAFGGIYWYLKKLQPNLKVAVITTQMSEISALPLAKEDKASGSFSIVVPSDFTRTY